MHLSALNFMYMIFKLLVSSSTKMWNRKIKQNYPQIFLLDSHIICFAFLSTRAANTDTIAHSCTHFSILSRSKQIAIQTYGMNFDTFSTVNLHIKNIFHTKQRDVLIFASMHLRTLLSTKYIQVYKLEPHQRDSFRSRKISSLGK